jgi:hypothetical protein
MNVAEILGIFSNLAVCQVNRIARPYPYPFNPPDNSRYCAPNPSEFVDESAGASAARNATGRDPGCRTQDGPGAGAFAARSLFPGLSAGRRPAAAQRLVQIDNGHQLRTAYRR